MRTIVTGLGGLIGLEGECMLCTERWEVIHTAAQPSHGKAASISYNDFDVDAGRTLNLLVAARLMRADFA